MSAAGSPDKSILLGMTQADYLRIYDAFYSGDWDDIHQYIAGRRHETGKETGRLPTLDRQTMYTEMLVRMKVLDIMGGLSESLARYVMTGNVDDLRLPDTTVHPFDVKPRELVAGTDTTPAITWMEKPNQFYDSVVHYLNLEIGAASWELRGKEYHEVVKPLGMEAHDMLAYTKARQLLAEWGWPAFKGEWTRRVLPDGSEIIAPQMLLDEIDAAVDRAQPLGTSRGVRTPAGELPIVAKVLAGERPIGDAVRPVAKATIGAVIDYVTNPLRSLDTMIKMGLTVGPLGMVAPMYSFVNFVGGGFQAYQRAGLAGPTAPLRQAKMTAAVMRRVWGDGMRAVGDAVIVAPDGRIYTADMVADMTVSEGMTGSYIKSETARPLVEALRNRHAGWWKTMMRSPARFQEFLVDVVTQVDNFWRISLFADGLEKGLAPSEAAKVARESAFDYNAQTDFEKQTVGKWIMFYSYIRKNQDLFWDTMLTNPHRIMGQLRLMKDLNEWFLEDDPQIVVPEWYDLRMALYFKEGMKKDVKNSGFVWWAPAMPAMDALGFWIDIRDAIAGSDQATRKLGSKLTPFPQAAISRVTGTDISTGADITSEKVIPPWFIEYDYWLFNGMMTRPGGWLDVSVLTPAPNESQWYEPGNPMVYYAGNGWRWAVVRKWLTFVPGMGRSMETINILDRANVGPVDAMIEASQKKRGVRVGALEPRGNLTELDELWGMIGMKPIAIPRYQFVLEQGAEAAADEARVQKKLAEQSRQPLR